jgi:hypothetical protein
LVAWLLLPDNHPSPEPFALIEVGMPLDEARAHLTTGQGYRGTLGPTLVKPPSDYWVQVYSYGEDGSIVIYWNSKDRIAEKRWCPIFKPSWTTRALGWLDRLRAATGL